MTDREMNKLMMFKAIRDFLIAIQDVIARIPAMPRLLAELVEKVAAIENTATKHASVAMGKTGIKIENEEKLLEQIRVKSSALYAFAKRHGRFEALAISEKSDWQYRVMRDEELIRAAEVLYKELRNVGPEFTDYGIGEAEIAEFRQSIDAFAKALGTRDSSRTERVLSRVELASLFNQVHVLLTDELDPMMELFRASDSQMYDNYMALRVTKALASRGRKENGKPDSPVNGNGSIPAAPESAVSGASTPLPASENPAPSMSDPQAG